MYVPVNNASENHFSTENSGQNSLGQGVNDTVGKIATLTGPIL